MCVLREAFPFPGEGLEKSEFKTWPFVAVSNADQNLCAEYLYRPNVAATGHATFPFQNWKTS
jgi:hypothetical protein